MPPSTNPAKRQGGLAIGRGNKLREARTGEWVYLDQGERDDKR